MRFRHGQIIDHGLLALYWFGRAVTGSAARRDVSDGAGRPFTPEEKTDEAFATMLRHIHLLRDCCEDLPTDEGERSA